MPIKIKQFLLLVAVSGCVGIVISTLQYGYAFIESSPRYRIELYLVVLFTLIVCLFLKLLDISHSKLRVISKKIIIDEYLLEAAGKNEALLERLSHHCIIPLYVGEENFDAVRKRIAFEEPSLNHVVANAWQLQCAPLDKKTIQAFQNAASNGKPQHRWF